MNEDNIDNNFPQMSFEELKECVPLEVAFDKLRERLVNIMPLIHDAVHSLLNYNQGEEIDSE